MPKSYLKLNILQVIPSLSSGGVERIVYELAKFLNDQGHQVIVLTSGGQLADELSQLGITIIKANIGSKNPFTIFKNIWLIKKILNEYAIDILHVHSRAPAWSCWFASKQACVKLITSFHGIYGTNNYFKRFYNSIMTKGDVIIAVSNFVKQHILANYSSSEKKIHVIHNGVDCELFNNHFSNEDLKSFRLKYQIRPELPVILLAARFTSWKGHLFLIKALGLVKTKYQCIMVGKYPKNMELIRQIESSIKMSGYEEHIKIFPQEANMPALYAIADIIVSSSTDPEAFGLTIIEGQAMQKLVIAPDYGGAGETIIDGVTGLHYQANDYISFGNKIEYGLSLLNSESAKQIRVQARAHTCENFSNKQMLTQTIKVYRDALSLAD